MAVSKKYRRKIVRNDRIFWWCVKPIDDIYSGLQYGAEVGLLGYNQLSIVSDDNKFIVEYCQNQINPLSKIKNKHIITKGKEFKGLDNLGHGWERFVVPEWDDEIITPSLVAKIIDWCFIIEDVVSVDWCGNILTERYQIN